MFSSQLTRPWLVFPAARWRRGLSAAALGEGGCPAKDGGSEPDLSKGTVGSPFLFWNRNGSKDAPASAAEGRYGEASP